VSADVVVDFGGVRDCVGAGISYRYPNEAATHVRLRTGADQSFRLNIA